MRWLRNPRKIVRVVSWVVLALVLYVGAHVLLVLHPDVLFSEHHTYKSFSVHMREPIPPSLEPLLDRVETLLATSELDDDSLHHEIYLVNSPRLMRFLLWRDVHFGANLLSGITYITDADVNQDLARPWPVLGPADRRVRTLSESIAHEIAHRLLRRRVGWMKDRQLPTWLKEGYCEYVAQGGAIDDEIGLAILLHPGHASVPGYAQFQNRLMVEYLINVRGLSLDELLAAPPDARDVWNRVGGGLREDPAGFFKLLRARPSDPPERSGVRESNPSAR